MSCDGGGGCRWFGSSGFVEGGGRREELEV